MLTQILPPKSPETWCNCMECRLAKNSEDSKLGRRVPQPAFHDCLYIAERANRVQAASEAADAAVVCSLGEPDRAQYSDSQWAKYLAKATKLFNRQFSREMERPLTHFTVVR